MVLHAETIRHDFFTVSHTIETRASPEGTSQERPWSWETSICRGNSRQRARKLIQKNKPNKTTQRLKVVKALKQSHSIREKSHFSGNWVLMGKHASHCSWYRLFASSSQRVNPHKFGVVFSDLIDFSICSKHEKKSFFLILFPLVWGYKVVDIRKSFFHRWRHIRHVAENCFVFFSLFFS